MSKLQLPSGWKDTTLGEVIDFIVDNRGRNPEYYVESGIPVIDNILIKDSRKIDLEESRRFIDENIFKNFIRKYNETGDVIITLVGNGYGNIALFPKEKSVIIQNTIGLRTNQESLNLFLYYLLRHDKKKILDLNIGAAQPSIKVGDLLGISISLPPLPEQVAIASLLSSFDDKIELLREQNKTLETLGQAIFQEWFGKYSVDDPESLPDGWRVGKLGEEFDIKQGKYIKADLISDKKTKAFQYPVYGGAGIRGYLENYIHNDNITILTCRGNGCGFINYSKKRSTITNSCMSFKPSNDLISQVFIYFLLRTIQFDDYTSGSAQPQITRTNIENIEITIPSNEDLNKFNAILHTLFEKISGNKEQIQSLAKTRDTMLPKLMSGEVRVEF